MYVADLMSRNFVSCKQEDDPSMLEMVHVIHRSIEFSREKYEEMKNETNMDDCLSKIIHFYKNGWPDKKNNLSGEIVHFLSLKSDLTVQDNFVFFEEKLVVPRSIRGYLLKVAHETHLGFEKIKDQLCSRFYWPGIKSDLKNMVSACPVCQTFQRSKIRDSLLPHSIPDIPFMKVGVDFAEHGHKNYFVLVDYYSRWLEMFEVQDKTAETAILCLKEIFSRFVIPRTVVTDNVPFNSFAFKSFAKDWNFEINFISPHYSQSNGLVEKAVGITKLMLKKCNQERGDMSLYLLNYRNSPVAGLKFSPAQLLQCKQLRTQFPTDSNDLKPAVPPLDILKLMNKQKEKQSSHYNTTAKVKESSFDTGEKVLVQDVFSKKWEPAIIVTACDFPRSYKWLNC